MLLQILVGCSTTQMPYSEFSLSSDEAYIGDTIQILWKINNAHRCSVSIYSGTENVLSQYSQASVIGGRIVHTVDSTKTYELYLLRDEKILEMKKKILKVKGINKDKIPVLSDTKTDSLTIQMPFPRIGSEIVPPASISEISLPVNPNLGVVKRNLGGSINSSCDDLMPVVSPDGRFLFLARYSEYKRECDNFQKIWLSKRQEDGNWSTIEKVSFPLNNSSHCGVISVLPDNNYLLLMNQYYPDGSPKGGGVSYSTRGVNGMWNIPRDVIIQNFYNLNRYAEFNLSADRTVLVMSIQRNDSYGGKDIYVSFRLSDDYFSEPLNIGKSVNTDRTEISPFLSSDGKTMYFSSDGHPGFGGADIFVTKRLDDTWKNWSKPINLGNEINTNQFDAYFTITSDGKEVYMVSSGIDNSSDVIEIELPFNEEVSPLPVTLTRGKLINVSDIRKKSARIVYRTNSKPERWGYAITNPDDGSFQIVLPAGDDYTIYADGNDLFPILKQYSTKKQNTYQIVEKNLYQTDLENMDFDTDLLTFGNGDTQLMPESYKEVSKIVKFLKLNTHLKVEVAGYTDDRGSEQLNLEISKKRALSVANYLTQNGILKSRIKVSGYGNKNFLYSNIEENGRKKNRRVEFLFF